MYTTGMCQHSSSSVHCSLFKSHVVFFFVCVVVACSEYLNLDSLSILRETPLYTHGLTAPNVRRYESTLLVALFRRSHPDQNIQLILLHIRIATLLMKRENSNCYLCYHFYFL